MMTTIMSIDMAFDIRRVAFYIRGKFQTCVQHVLQYGMNSMLYFDPE